MSALLKRYHMNISRSNESVWAEENLRGEWVKYADASALEARNGELEARIKGFVEFLTDACDSALQDTPAGEELPEWYDEACVLLGVEDAHARAEARAALGQKEEKILGDKKQE